MNYRYGSSDVSLLRYLEERVERNPSSSFFAMLSYFYLEIGKVAEALSIAQRGVIAHPNYSTGHAILAMAMMKARLFYDARKELVRAAELNPDSKTIESLSAALDKQEQADEIGKKLAEQFHANRTGGKDLMKTIEDTIEVYRQKVRNDDSIIPGLDAIVGGEPGKITPELKTPSLIHSQAETLSKYRDVDRDGRELPGDKRKESSTIARAIIEKVTREIESKAPSDSGGSTNGSSPPQTDSAAAERPASARVPPETSGDVGPDEAELDSGDFNLDDLARELEAAGPIKPQEDHPRDRSDESGIELTPEIVTETLAQIFEQQGQLKTAIEAYGILMRKKPEQAEVYQQKIAELTQRTNG
ncbi:MAG TPA: hypothetical protein VLX91_02440 [Candidatus Acidoferrales bacterium]|nr:hypothetical protein [Candidatus Acidoferrales bacterium]